MLASVTVRRFTPPTCTLEIKAKTSPLSRWTARSVFKNLRFRLSFDDPKIPQEEQVTIQGDRLQLEQLYNAVIDYTQNFLHGSFTDGTSPALRGRGHVLTNSNLTTTATSANEPYLQPQGLVNHELWLGSLANNNPVTKIPLSSVQLFDLVTALEEYHTQVMALPQIDTAKSRILPIWVSVAAVIILAIGLTPAIVKLSQKSESDSISSSSKSAPPAAVPKLNDLDPPQVPSTSIEPKPQLEQPLTSTEKLPPPPAVDVLKPQPDIPDPAQYPLPEVAARSRINPVSPDAASDTVNSPQVESTITIPPKTENSQAEPSVVTIAPPETQTSERSPESVSQANKTKQSDSESVAIAIPEDRPQNSSSPLSDSPSPSQPSVANLEPNNLSSRPNSNSPITQATNYFQEKWQPPDELKQSLEYRLLVDANGKIKKVIPIGKASAMYLNRTKIPLQQEAFIDPLPDRNQIVIRLLLNPDGEVAAFLE